MKRNSASGGRAGMMCLALACGALACGALAAGPPPPIAPASAPAAAKALRAWVGDVLAPDFVSDSNRVGGKAGPLRIVAARNGAFSGKVVLSCGEPIRGLSVQVGELKGPARLAASAVQVRYATPWDRIMTNQAPDLSPVRYSPRAGYLGLLAEEPPKEFPLGRIAVRRGGRNLFDTYGAVVPVWITLSVPRDAAPGEYTAQVAIQAAGQKPLSVPLELKVTAWTLSDVEKWQTWVDLVESPDTLALEYGAEPWSQKHWDLIARSMRFLRQVGNRVLYVPLICQTNMGHEQSMVRWVRKASAKPAAAGTGPAGEAYDLDFSILDRYLDTAVQEMGRPQVVVLYVWENYMIRKGQVATGAAAAHEQQRILDQMEKEGTMMGKGPAVSVLAPGAKTPTPEYLPHYTDPASRALWKPLFEELKRRLQTRGLAQAAMLGMINDCWPTREEVQFFADQAPGMPWVLHAHFGRGDAYGLAKVGYRAQVWSLDAPAKGKSQMGWKRPDLLARFQRDGEFGQAPLHAWRFWEEYCLTGGQRGPARLGGDYWAVLKDKAGQRAGRAGDRYPQSTWRNLGIYTSLLAPGADGPVATPRLEVFREGLQECEARIAVEKALSDAASLARLGEDLARRCQEALDDRLAHMLQNMENRPGSRPGWAWTLASGWQERSERLFTLAAEVAAKAGGN